MTAWNWSPREMRPTRQRAAPNALFAPSIRPGAATADPGSGSGPELGPIAGVGAGAGVGVVVGRGSNDGGGVEYGSVMVSTIRRSARLHLVRPRKVCHIRTRPALARPVYLPQTIVNGTSVPTPSPI